VDHQFYDYAKSLSAMPSFVTWGMSQFAKNPVPGGLDFITLEPSGNVAQIELDTPTIATVLPKNL
jgi:hypothetical protein